MAGLSNDRGGEAPDERHRKVTSGEAVDQKLRNFGRLSSGPRMVGSAEPISPSHVFPKRYTALRVVRPMLPGSSCAVTSGSSSALNMEN
jgi:hypothetical protein